MKTHPNTTAWLKLVVLDGDRDAIMVTATTGRSEGFSIRFAAIGVKQIVPRRDVKRIRVNSTK
jgi:hypothetical protein